MYLSKTEFQLLALVVSQERSGREVAKLFQEEVGKNISYGTLYTTFRRLKEKGYVKCRDAQDEDGRVRYFRVTGNGVEALEEIRNHYLKLAAFQIPKFA